MSETDSEMASPEAEEDVDIGTAARTRPLSYDEIIQRRTSKSERVDSEIEPSRSTDFDDGAQREQISRSRTEGWRLASMVVSARAEEEPELDQRGRDDDNDGSTLRRSDMRDYNRYEEQRGKRRRSASQERHKRERERESHHRERNRQDFQAERKFNSRRELPPERRINVRELPPPPLPVRSSEKRKYSRIDRPSSPERRPINRDHPISHSLVRRSDRRDHPHGERQPETKDRISGRSPRRRAPLEQPRAAFSPKRRPERRQQQQQSRSPLRRDEKQHGRHSLSPQRRADKQDRPRSGSPENRPEKRNRPVSPSAARKPMQDRHRSRSPERKSSKREQPHSYSSGIKSDKPERPHSPERKPDKRDQPEKKVDKIVNPDKDNTVDNSLNKQIQENKTEMPQMSAVEKKSDKWDRQPPPARVSIPDQPNFSSILGAVQTTIQNMLETGVMMVEPVQLTQATRPKRRLYIEEIPDSASERALIDEINGFFPGSNPCLTCTINKERRQALVEFLTPDDATKALSFDGRSLLGTVLKIRRPKDYVEMPDIAPEKPAEEVKVISDIVKDSCHKIFVAGIHPELLSSEELMEIVSVWGSLKGFHFMHSEELGEPCAFFEFEDHSVTLNACAGLNGMRIGTRSITVVRAFPEASDEPLDEKSPSYDVPLHAKSLLVDATPILYLRNMYDRDKFLQMSKSEVEEDIEDIRITCARFGTVKTVKIVPFIESTTVPVENGTLEIHKNVPNETRHAESSPLPSPTRNTDSSPLTSPTGDEHENGSVSETSPHELNTKSEPSIRETSSNEDVMNGMESENDILVEGSVLVEFVRKEAARAAAHELHGESFSGRVIEAGYAPLEVFLNRFYRREGETERGQER